jgi:hypothetical protein
MYCLITNKFSVLMNTRHGVIDLFILTTQDLSDVIY